jgi:hypothetical protein
MHMGRLGSAEGTAADQAGQASAANVAGAAAVNASLFVPGSYYNATYSPPNSSWAQILAAWNGQPNSTIYWNGQTWTANCVVDTYATSVAGSIVYYQPYALLSISGYPSYGSGPGSPYETATSLAQSAGVPTILAPGVGGNVTDVYSNPIGNYNGLWDLMKVAGVVMAIAGGAEAYGALTTTAADGSVTAVAPDLSSSVTTTTAGDVTTVASDGSVTTTSLDGSSVTTFPNGSTSITTAEGDTITTAADGTVTLPPDLTPSTVPADDILPAVSDPALATAPVDSIPDLPATDAAALAASGSDLALPAGTGAAAQAANSLLKAGSSSAGTGNSASSVLAPTATLSPWSFLLLGAIAVLAITS